MRPILLEIEVKREPWFGSSGWNREKLPWGAMQAPLTQLLERPTMVR